MNLRELNGSWTVDEASDIDASEFALMGMIKIPDPFFDDPFPYNPAPIIEIVVDHEDESVEFVLGELCSSPDDAVRLGAAREMMEPELEEHGDYEILLREQLVDDEVAEGGDKSLNFIASPIVGIGVNGPASMFALFKWFEGAQPTGLFQTEKELSPQRKRYEEYLQSMAEQTESLDQG